MERNVVSLAGEELQALKDMADASYRISTAIRSDDAPGHDAQGGHVSCLVEACMGITAALTSIAGAIEDLAAATREAGGVNSSQFDDDMR